MKLRMIFVPLAFAGCRAGEYTSSIAVPPAAEQAVSVGDEVTLTDRSDLLLTQWTVLTAPINSALHPGDLFEGSEVRFIVDAEGQFDFLTLTCDEKGRCQEEITQVYTLQTRMAQAASAQAVIGALSTTTPGQPIDLIGSASTTTQSSPLSYRWSLRSAPDCSVRESSSIRRRLYADSWFIPDCEGTFQLRLWVSDGTTSSTADTNLLVTPGNAPPIPIVTGYTEYELGSVVSLNSGGSYDREGDPIILRWSLSSVPDGSTLTSQAFSSRYTTTTTFTPDVPGAYVVRLWVRDANHIIEDHGHLDIYVNSFTLGN